MIGPPHMQLATAGRANPKERFGPDGSIARGTDTTHSDTADLMARKRMVSPEVFTSRTVNGWPVASRWTWVGLFGYLDDYGYGDDSPPLVKAAVWPLDDTYSSDDVAADLDRFATSGSLCRFVCCDKPQIHAPKWSEWQTVQHPAKPRFCVCPKHSRQAHEQHLKLSREHHETLSLIEVSSSQRSSSDTGEGLATFHAVRDQIRGVSA